MHQHSLRLVLTLIALTSLTGCDQTGGPTSPAASTSGSTPPASVPVQGQYADINGLKMYYEVHGTGQPLVILHGAFGTATVFPHLLKDRQVIAVELQGHGHTADIDRPLSFEQMADDVAALLKHLQIREADFVGYSMGGNVALATAIRHKRLVRKLVTIGSNAGKIEEAYQPEALQQFKNLPPDFAPPMLKAPYDKVAPDPAQWPQVVAKLKQMGLEFPGFTATQLESIQAHTLIALGDHDVVRPEHAVAMYRQIPGSQLAIFPGADHFLVFQNPDALFSVILAFLNAPLPPNWQ